MIIKKKSITLNIILEYIIVFIAIILSGCPLGTLYYSQITIGLLLISFVFVMLKKKQKVNKRQINYVFSLIACLIFTLFVNFDHSLSHYFGRIFSYLSVLFICWVIERNKLLHKYINLIFILSIISIVLTFLVYINTSFSSKLSEIYFEGAGSWSHFNYIYYIWGKYSTHWVYFPRNSAFFREPGVFATHLCICMMLLISKGEEFYYSVKQIHNYILVFIIAALSTLSTVGVLGSAILFAYYLHKRKFKYLKPFLIVAAIVVLAVFVNENWYILFNKFNSAGNQYTSVTDRTQGMIDGINAWIKNPLFGKGYTYFKENSNSVSPFFITDFLGKYGVIFTGIFCYGVHKFIKFISKSKFEYLLFLAVYSLFLVTQGLVDMPIFMALQVISLYRISGRKEVNRKETFNENSLAL